MTRRQSPRMEAPVRALLAAVAFLAAPVLAAGASPAPELLRTDHELGRRGGRLVYALRSEPKTLNPVTSLDSASRDVIGRLNANLIRIDRHTQQTTPALARSWTASPDGRRYTLELRRGIRFSDGHPLDADDVVFSFQCYLDERNGSPQRDLLIVGGKPVVVRKLGPYRVSLEMEQPYAVAERLFDGISILPRHLLEKAQQEGRLTQAWGLGTPPAQMAGLGPFRLKSYVPGERVVLERNPHYWKVDRAGQALPYLEELVFLFVPSEEADVIRFKAGESDLIVRLSAENFAALSRDRAAERYRLEDLGAGLEYSFLFFNLNDVDAGKLPAVARKQAWFRQTAFRQAVSAALDRPGIVRLVYQGRATPLGTHVTPGNKLWVNAALRPAPRALARAREILAAAGFSWNAEGTLLDRGGAPVEFTIVTTAGNSARAKMATVVEDDLRQLGMRARLVPLEHRALLDRVFQSHDYDAAVMALASGDVDPNVEMNVWLSTGATHLWRLGASGPGTPWESEIDDLMRRQLVTLDPRARKQQYDRVQALVAENLPLIPLVSPNLLVGAKTGLANVRPGILDPYVLWNVDELFWQPQALRAGGWGTKR
jgi:peptide/nickel transport system substrate-binding protein